MKAKIWIVGVNGRLGSILYEHLNPLDLELLGTDKYEVDITDSKNVNDYVEMNRPDIIINTAGLSDRDYCEENPKKAFLVNSIGARNIAVAAERIKAKLVQISTADVFDGDTLSPYREIDIANPKSIYGKSELLGEEYVKRFSRRHFIIRSSRVYSKKNLFVENIQKEARTKGLVKVPKNQFASYTSAYDLAKFIMYIIETNEFGTYHASCLGVASRKEFSEEVLRLSNLTAEVIEIENHSSQDFKPSYMALENFILDLSGDYLFDDWKSSLNSYIERQVKNDW